MKKILIKRFYYDAENICTIKLETSYGHFLQYLGWNKESRTMVTKQSSISSAQKGRKFEKRKAIIPAYLM